MERKNLLSSTATAAALLFAGNGDVPSWLQLTPVSKGTFKAQDGREFRIDDAAAVIAASLERGGIPIDRDHATDLAAKNGNPAPAVGWITKIALHGPNNEEGLWGEVSWTPAGKQMVADREYRFISPVLFHAKTNTTVVAIGRAALTNDPALVMKGLFSMQENDDVDLKALCALLGLPETATADDVSAKIKSLVQANSAMCALEKRIAEAAGLDVSKFEKLDETATVALCTKLKTPAAMGDAAEVAKLRADLDQANIKIATLARESQGRTATAEVETAIKSGKIIPAQKDWAIDYCTRDPEGFKKFIGSQPVILEGGRVAPAGQAADALTEIEIAVCAQLGLKPEDFKAQKALAVKGAA